MDLNLIRAVLTALAFSCFIGIALWAYQGRQRARFDEAARLPLWDEQDDVAKDRQ